MISKHTGTKRGGVVTWVKGAWNAAGNTQELNDVEARIDRAVSDLTLSEVWRGNTQQERGFAQLVHAALYTFPERPGRGAQLA